MQLVCDTFLWSWGLDSAGCQLIVVWLYAYMKATWKVPTSFVVNLQELQNFSFLISKDKVYKFIVHECINFFMLLFSSCCFTLMWLQHSTYHLPLLEFEINVFIKASSHPEEKIPTSVFWSFACATKPSKIFGPLRKKGPLIYQQH